MWWDWFDYFKWFCFSPNHRAVSARFFFKLSYLVHFFSALCLMQVIFLPKPINLSLSILEEPIHCSWFEYKIPFPPCFCSPRKPIFLSELLQIHSFPPPLSHHLSCLTLIVRQFVVVKRVRTYLTAVSRCLFGINFLLLSARCLRNGKLVASHWPLGEWICVLTGHRNATKAWCFPEVDGRSWILDSVAELLTEYLGKAHTYMLLYTKTDRFSYIFLNFSFTFAWEDLKGVFLKKKKKQVLTLKLLGHLFSVPASKNPSWWEDWMG